MLDFIHCAVILSRTYLIAGTMVGVKINFGNFVKYRTPLLTTVVQGALLKINVSKDIVLIFVY